LAANDYPDDFEDERWRPGWSPARRDRPASSDSKHVKLAQVGSVYAVAPPHPIRDAGGQQI